MNKTNSIFKRSLAALLALLVILSMGLTNVIALTVDMVETSANVELAETGADTTYTIAGVFNGWDTTKNPMEETTDVFNNTIWIFGPSTFTGEFKITDGSWSNSWGNSSANIDNGTYADYGVIELATGNNNNINMSHTGTHYIIFNPTTKKTSATTMSPEAVTKYTVTFKNGTETFATQSITDGEYATAPATNPTKNGYTFKYWSTTENGAEVNFATYAITEATTFYAVWEANTYTVTFKDDDGDVLKTASVKYNEAIGSSNVPANPIKDRTDEFTYTFKAWKIGSSEYTPANVANYKVTGDTTVTAVYTSATNQYTFAIGTYNTAEGGVTAVPTAGDHDYNTSIVVTAEPTDDYKFSYWEITYTDGTPAATSTTNPLTISLTKDTTVTPVFISKTFYYITVEEVSLNEASGSVRVVAGETELETETSGEYVGKYKVENGTEVTIIAEVSDEKYYVKSINTTTFAQTATKAHKELTIEDNTTVTVTYDKRDTYSVTVNNTNAAAGNVSPATVADKYIGDTVLFTATANDGYVFDGWTVSGTNTYSGADTTTLTVTVESSEITVIANWEENPYVSLTLRAPKTQGSAEGTLDSLTIVDTDSSNATPNVYSTLNVGDTVTLTATANTDANYAFDSWNIVGAYEPVTGSTSDASITIKVNGNVTATANFKITKKYIYIQNGATSVYETLYVQAQDVNSGSYFTPTDTTTIDNTLYYKIEITDSTGWINIENHGQNTNNFSTDYGNNKQYNCFYITGAKTGYWGNITEGSGTASGYALEYEDGTKLTLDDYGDGLYSATAEFDNTITELNVNPYSNSTKNYWNFSGTAGDNPASVTEGTTTKGNAVPVNLGESEAGFEVTFTFDPVNYTLSWSATKLKAKVKVYLQNGIAMNSLDNLETGNSIGRIGETTMKADGVNVFSFTDYGNSNVAENSGTATVAKGEMVTVYTELKDRVKKTVNNVTAPIYKLEGWVVNGTDFIKANTTDGINYYGTYEFEAEESTVTPVYFHTDEWMETNEVNKVTVYAILDKSISSWTTHITSYTWFYLPNGTTTQYAQFDGWSGQLMIPLGNGVYYTYIETNTPEQDGITATTASPYSKEISGITFANKFGRNMNDDSWQQTYDYYEFVKLKDKFRVTFVLKNHKVDNQYVNNQETNPGNSITINDYDWTRYIDYNNNYLDIYRNVTVSTVSDEENQSATNNKLYILRSADWDTITTNESNYYKDDNGLAVGEYFVKTQVYDSEGTLIDTCVSYELVDKDSNFYTNLATYISNNNLSEDYFKYGDVYVSYEGMKNSNADRFDGEWFADETDTTQIDVKALIGLTNGSDVILDTNTGDYGTATVNMQPSVTVVRGDKVKLLASEKPGYKFVGWYYVNTVDNEKVLGDEISTEIAYDITVANRTTVVAMYKTRTTGEFEVRNVKYGGDPTNALAPKANGGDSYRYVSIIHQKNDGTTVTYDKTANEIGDIITTEGDKLTITIYTDAYYEDDYFYAWYVPVWENGMIVNFEEVAVSEQNRNQKGEVSFTFEYEVKSGDTGITIYSDIYHFDITKDIIYQYKDRYGVTKNYIKPQYTLTAAELENKVPSEETILKFAPFVEDLYKDTQWVFADKFSNESWTLVATQAPPQYSVTVMENGEAKDIGDFYYNETVSILASGSNNNGYWSNKPNGKADEGGKVLAYGAYYGLQVKEDTTLYYITLGDEDTLDFDVVLDEAIYGREQSGVSGTTDKIYVDYLASIHVPIFVGDTDPNGNKITENVYTSDGTQIILPSANSPVTLETLKEHGYEVEHGIITQQIGNFKVGEDQAYATYEDALAAAVLEGYGNTKNINSILEAVVKAEGTSGTGVSLGTGVSYAWGSKDEYYTVYDLSDENITSKNRYPFTLIFNNTVVTRGRFYNVYAYVAVTDNVTGLTSYYFSNVQTLNTYTAGTTTIDKDGNVIDANGNLVTK